MQLDNLLIETEQDLSLPHELYIMTQIFNGKEGSKIYFKMVSELTIMKFTIMLAGTVVVYKYNKKNNSREDLTSSLGRIEPELRPYREVSLVSIMQLHTSVYGEYYLKIKNIYIHRDIGRFSYLSRAINLKVVNVNMASIEIKSTQATRFLNTYIINGLVAPKNEYKKSTRYTYYGSEYEKFIGKKYEANGYKVIYNGIQNGVQDHGIDLIAKRDKQHILVQCKSWKNNNYFKIKQKDIRAFVGDSCLYAMSHNIEHELLTLHFIIADAKSITQNALRLVKNTKKIKFKVVPFENTQ